MRLTRQTRKPGRIGLNMAAMVDVVFLLLIFFMCTSAAPEIENELPTDLPRITGEVPKKEELDPIRIRLTGSGGNVRLSCDGQTCVDAAGRASFDVLVAKLARRHAVLDASVVEPTVIISGEGEVPFGHMVRALNSGKTVGFKRVYFSAKGTDS